MPINYILLLPSMLNHKYLLKLDYTSDTFYYTRGS